MVRAPSPRQPEQPSRGRRTTRNPVPATPALAWPRVPHPRRGPHAGPPCSPTWPYDVSLRPDRPGDVRRRGPRSGSTAPSRAPPPSWSSRTRLGLDGAPARRSGRTTGGGSGWTGLEREQRGTGRGAAPLRHRRRRDAHVHRPGRRRDLRVGVRRHGHRPAGLPLLRPARPQGAGHPRRHRPRGLDGARQRPPGRPRRRAASGASRPRRRSRRADVRGLRRARGTR